MDTLTREFTLPGIRPPQTHGHFAPENFPMYSPFRKKYPPENFPPNYQLSVTASGQLVNHNWVMINVGLDFYARGPPQRAGLPLSFLSRAYVRQGVYFGELGTPEVSIFGVRQAFHSNFRHNFRPARNDEADQ